MGINEKYALHGSATDRRDGWVLFFLHVDYNTETLTVRTNVTRKNNSAVSRLNPIVLRLDRADR